MLISIIVPIYNEEGNISLLCQKIADVMEKHNYEIILIDDGSTDNTLNTIKNLHKDNDKINYISFSRNFGHQNALKAGLDNAKGDCVISMDGDLQHPPELIPIMIEKYKDGFDIVFTIRKDDPNTGFFKKITANIFYKIINKLSDLKIEQGSADFRLLDRKVVEVLKTFNETSLFYRGIMSWLGFRQCGIEYLPQERFWGKTKYSISKMIKFAITGITSFSIRPLQCSIYLGFFMAFISFGYALYAIYIKLFTDLSVQGWTSLLFVISFIGGIQMIMIGILGEYIGRLFIESKKRPNYIIRESNLV